MHGDIVDGVFDAFRQKGRLEGIRDARDQDKEIEERKGDGDVAGANAGDTESIGKSANKVDDEGQHQNKEKLRVHPVHQ